MRHGLTLIALLGLCSAAQAHLLPKQNATMNIVEQAAFFVVSVPASTLQGVDDDASGTLSAAEIGSHQADIRRQFEARFALSNDGRPGVPVLTMVLSPLTDGEVGESDYVVVMHRVNFDQAPQTPELRTDLFGSGDGESQMTLAAQHGEVKEVAILQTGAGTHTFFRGAWATFVDFIGIGTGHILQGPDHLLFLLTILIGAAGWRHWLGVVTAFTIAHSITLVLSALQLIRIPALLVEPGIAASIVLMALVNLRALRSATPGGIGSRVAIVFACGLLHGLGFAAAVGAMAVDAGSRWATLAGFNIGIEIGQLLFLGAVVVVVTLLGRAGRLRVIENLPALASGSAALFGTALLLQRLLVG